MSSSGLNGPQDPWLYHWSDTLHSADYLFARYEVSSTRDGRSTAVAMAMEQSVGATRIQAYLSPDTLAPYCIRVKDVHELPGQGSNGVASYSLHTPVYGESLSAGGDFSIELAIPLSLLAGKPAQLWNILIGELPRLGFLTRFRLVEAVLPAHFGPGPAFGVAGLRRLAQQRTGPLLCRSMRPAVGLPTETMAKMNYEVLRGGFHIVKDDELQVFPDYTAFEQHLRAMIDARDAATAATGERKLYFANLICEPWELEARWTCCQRLGVDGVLVAPWIQGLGTLAHLAAQRRLPLLAHNTMGELLTRNPDWHIDEAVLSQWLRIMGADLFVTRGDFADVPDARTDPIHLEPARSDHNALAAMLPILQGGKHPGGLRQYRETVGSDDFMLIVASWVDHHPGGLQEGARAFRRALETSESAVD